MRQKILISLGSVLLFASTLAATTLGEDAAHAFAYADGWAHGDDGSTLGNPDTYGIWFLGGEGEHLIGDSTQVAGGDGADINQQGKAFRLRSIDGSTADAFRFIDPDGLLPGESFSIELAVNYRSGSKGITFRGIGEEHPEIFSFEISGDDYLVKNASSGNGRVSEYYSNRTKFTVTLIQVTAEMGEWIIRRGGELREEKRGLYSGQLRSIRVFNTGQGDAPEDDLYFNTLRVDRTE